MMRISVTHLSLLALAGMLPATAAAQAQGVRASAPDAPGLESQPIGECSESPLPTAGPALGSSWGAPQRQQVAPSREAGRLPTREDPVLWCFGPDDPRCAPADRGAEGQPRLATWQPPTPVQASCTAFRDRGQRLRSCGAARLVPESAHRERLERPPRSAG